MDDDEFRSEGGVMSNCAMCEAAEAGCTEFTFTAVTDIVVCQGHWDHILASSQDGPYMNLPPGRVQLEAS